MMIKKEKMRQRNEILIVGSMIVPGQQTGSCTRCAQSNAHKNIESNDKQNMIGTQNEIYK